MAEPGQSSPDAGPRESAELDALRARIDAVDRSLLAALNERAELVREVGVLKQRTGTPVYEAGREKSIVSRLEAENPGPFPHAALAPVFREIISATRSLEEEQRIAFLGPAGTFSHQAARQQFGASARLDAQPTLGDVFVAVERGRAQLGIVPLENTTEGIVTTSFDALARSTVQVCGELLLPVREELLSLSGQLGEVRAVASHPQPLAQCRGWLERHLPHAERVETPSTAAAAERAARDGSVAAIGSAIAGEVYGLRTVQSSIEDRPDNSTRFVLIAREATPRRSGRDLTMVLFTLRKDESGALFRLLEPLASSGINLTSIQIRPLQGKPWEYLFFVDLEGHRDDERVQRALAGASQAAISSRVLGSFPRLRDAAAGEG